MTSIALIRLKVKAILRARPATASDKTYAGWSEIPLISDRVIP
jgi:hypothetical protein